MSSISFWNNVEVLVTGGHGFTGAHLCRELVGDGAKVRAFVKNGASLKNLSDIQDKIRICYGDVTDLESLLKCLEGVQYVFNPAAIVPVIEARKYPQKTLLVNGIGSFNVGAASVKSGVKKMLHISTCHIYGNQPEADLPMKESSTPLPQELYAASKYAAEIFLRPLIEDGFPIVISRAFGKYGPGQGPLYLVPRIINQLLDGKLPMLGNPKPTRDFSYIVDIVRGYMLMLEKGKSGEVYHLSSEKETSIGDMYQLIAKSMKSDLKPTWNNENRPNDIMRQIGTSQKARKELGWKPKISLEEGISKTIAWWKKQRGTSAV